MAVFVALVCEARPLVAEEVLPDADFALLGLEGAGEWEGPSDYAIEHWDRDEGLPHHGVFSISQTSDGYLWLGTEFGVARFDGVRFTFFPAHQASGIRGKITCLYADSRDRLWIASRDRGICRLENGQMVRVDDEAAGVIHNITEDRDGVIWVGHGVGLGFCEDDRIVNERSGKVLANGDASGDLAIDPSSGSLFFLLWENVHVLDDDSSMPYLKRSANMMTPRHAGGIWLIGYEPESRGRLQRLLPNRTFTQAEPLPFEVPQWAFRAFMEDRAGNLWIAVAERGLYRIGLDGVYELFGVGKDIAAVFEDDEGNIWAGSSTDGLFRIRRRTFKVFSTSDEDPVISVSGDGDGGVLFNTDKEEIFSLQDDSLSKLTLPALRTFLRADSGEFWTSHWLLNRYQPEESGYKILSVQGEPSFIGASAILQHSDGGLWFGGHLGLGHFDNNVFTPIRLDPEACNIRSLAEAPDGAMWLGTNGDGLRLLQRDGQVQRFRSAEGLGGEVVCALYVDAEDVLWIGTVDGGLDRLADGELTHYDKATGLPDDTICSITEDAFGNLWLGTFNGIIRVAREELEAVATGKQPTLHCYTFGTDAGLTSSECTISGKPNVYRAPDGKLWFATTKGVAMVDPTRVAIDEKPPPVIIERLLIDDQPHSFDDSLTVPPGSARMEIQYTGISLSAPDQVRFQYQLVGHDDDWIDAWDRRTAFYTKVPPGDYRFQVRAANSHGVWNATGAALSLRFRPHYWETVAFKIALVLLLVSLGAWGIRQISVRRYQRELALLEREHVIEQERTRIARDMHDQLGAEITQLGFQSQILSGQIDREARPGELAHVESIALTADNLVRGMDEVVWATDPAKDNLESLVAYLSYAAREFFKASSVRLRLDMPMEMPITMVPSETRHHLLLVVKEALTNVAKHADAEEVWLRFQLEAGNLIVVIDDDGGGVEESRSLREGNGLKNMKARMEAIGGTVEILSRSPSGTQVELTVQLEEAT